MEEGGDSPYVVTADTVLEFDYSSSAQGEIQGIGFDTDDVISRGSDVPVVWDPVELRDSDHVSIVTGVTHYVIPVGQFYTGTFDRLFFVNDHDVGFPGSRIGVLAM